MKNKWIIAIDVGGTKIAAAVVSPAGRILERLKIPSPKKAGAKKVVGILADLVADVLAEAGVKRKDALGIGVGIPGLVDARKGHVVVTPNMRLSHFAMAQALKKRTGLRARLGNDVNLGILGEKYFGAAAGAKDVVGIFVGTGVGGGILVDGKLLTGRQGVAAEIGHMIVDPRGPLCGCGNQGCLESHIGRWAMERDIRSAVKAGAKTVLSRWTDGKLDTIKSKFFRKALKKKDALTVKVMKKASVILGQACISLRHLFDPEVIVLGGGVMEACGEFLLPVVKKTVKKDPFFSRFKACRIELSQLGDDAILLGATALFR